LGERRASKVKRLLEERGVDGGATESIGLGAEFSRFPATAPGFFLKRHRRVVILRTG
jgi:outer membrane protein OmpA-like peptidoglycan-associated protein